MYIVYIQLHYNDVCALSDTVAVAEPRWWGRVEGAVPPHRDSCPPPQSKLEM